MPVEIENKSDTNNELDTLVRAARESAKYREICLELVTRIATRELQIRRNPKEALKETRNALHQIAGAYLSCRPRYDRWLETLTLARASENPNEWPETCARMMRLHAPTSERLPYLAEFYATLFDGLPPVHSVLDLACGFNPLALSLMPLAPDSSYFALDIYADMTQFFTDYFLLYEIKGTAQTADVAALTEFPKTDMALILKFLPVLEQQERGSSLRFLQAIPAKTLIVSFPTRTLAGYNKGMAESYESRFMALVAAEKWNIERFEFPGELCFRVSKSE